MKVVFFDIDGTLIGFDGSFQASTRKALELARANGHKLILSTGRNEVQIYPVLKEFGFDGVISAAGACVTCEGKNVYHNFVEKEQLEKFLQFFQGKGKCFGIQAESGSYVDQISYDIMRDKFLASGVGEEMVHSIMNRMTVEDPLQLHDDVEKLFYNDVDETVEEVQAALGDYFIVQQSSFHKPDPYSGEITCKGVMKSTGMQHVLSYFEAGVEDSIAFGDGPNDIDMIEYAGIGVAMGNARKEVQEVADYVTYDVLHDGIYHAMEHLQLI